MRRKNVVKPGDNVESIWKEPGDASFGSYGINECLDIVERELKKGNGVTRPDGEYWAEGTGMALAMLECGPPTEHRSGAEMKLLADGTYHLACGSCEMGQGIAYRAQADRCLHRRRTRQRRRPHGRRYRPHTLRHRHLRQHRYGRGGQGRPHHRRGDARRHPRDFAARHTGVVVDQCRLDNDAVVCGNKRILLTELHAAGAKVDHRFTVSRRAYLSPRTIAFNVQGVRLAVHRVTGEVRVLHSVHAADIGVRSIPTSATVRSTAPSPWATAGR